MASLLESLEEHLAITIAWFPYILTITIASMAVLTMNIPFMMFTVGLLLVILVTWPIGIGLHHLTTFLSRGKVPLWAPGTKCGVVPPIIGADSSLRSIFVPSTWMLVFSFTIAYMLQSAIALLNDGGLPPWLTDDQSLAASNAANVAVCVSIILLLWLMIHRYFTGCEEIVPVIMGVAFGVAGSVGWYQLANTCPRWIADFFGISARFPLNVSVLPAGVSAQCSATS